MLNAVTGGARNNPTILVAEDDVDDQELLILAFQKITDSHHLEIVNNGKAVIKFLTSLGDHELPCLIVLDFNMPELNGKEILKILHSQIRYQHIPKVIFTTSNSSLDKADCLSVGAMDYIIKPSSLDEIVNSAKKMLGYCAT